MRLYSEAEFLKELERYGFKRTGKKTQNTIALDYFGQIVVISRRRDSYPDFIIDDLLAHYTKDGVKTAPSVNLLYEVRD